MSEEQRERIKFSEAVIDAAGFRGAFAPSTLIFVAGIDADPRALWRQTEGAPWVILRWPDGLDQPAKLAELEDPEAVIAAIREIL